MTFRLLFRVRCRQVLPERTANSLSASTFISKETIKTVAKEIAGEEEMGQNIMVLPY